MTEESMKYLKVALGLAQTPSSMWTEEDHALLREVRSFVQREESRLESEREKESQEATGDASSV